MNVGSGSGFLLYDDAVDGFLRRFMKSFLVNFAEYVAWNEFLRSTVASTAKSTFRLLPLCFKSDMAFVSVAKERFSVEIEEIWMSSP